MKWGKEPICNGVVEGHSNTKCASFLIEFPKHKWNYHLFIGPIIT